MKPYYEDDQIALHHGDCLDILRQLPDASADAVVTDPPYGLGFMGKDWDDLPPGEEWARECLRVLKPGGHLLTFGGSRTWHRLAVAIEDAGFEIRDSIAWLYGSGFPKSMDVSKAIDKAAGAERPVIGEVKKLQSFDSTAAGEVNAVYGGGPDKGGVQQITAPATDEATRWEGWGTALKPAFEPVAVGRKPVEGTVAGNVLRFGVGALNIDGCRVGDEERVNPAAGNKPGGASLNMSRVGMPEDTEARTAVGRWPTNVVLDESQAAELDRQSGESKSHVGKPRAAAAAGAGWGMTATGTEHADSGGASRFFYVAKAGAEERPRVAGVAHPTVKPLALMRWLVRLVTPPAGVVLEPFAGSGTTVEACLVEGFRVVAIEREAEYLPLIEARIARRRDPVRAVELAGEDAGLFELLADGGAA